MSKNEQPPVIIKKIKKSHGHAHHGGAWKVAYADFVTAMMAFFLLLWLLNVTTDEQKRGIADYFAPSVASQNQPGSGGVLGGQTISVDGALVNDSAAASITVMLDAPAQELPEQDAAAEDEAEAAAQPEPPKVPVEASEVTALAVAEPPETSTDVSEDAATKLVKDLEEERFRQAEFELRQAIQDIPDIQQLAQNLIIDR